MFVADPETLTRSNQGVVTGVIFLDLDETRFPGEGWNDFAPEIVAWWLDRVERLWHHPGSVARCLFKDGPYEFRLTHTDGGYWRVECIRRGLGAEYLVHTHLIQRAECLGSLLKVADVLSAACKERGWTGGYEQYLCSRSAELARLLLA